MGQCLKYNVLCIISLGCVLYYFWSVDAGFELRISEHTETMALFELMHQLLLWNSDSKSRDEVKCKRRPSVFTQWSNMEHSWLCTLNEEREINVHGFVSVEVENLL